MTNRMVGTWGLEPQTSTVSILLDLTFQRLTFSAGAAKSLEGITRTERLWVGVWVGILDATRVLSPRAIRRRKIRQNKLASLAETRF